MPAAIAPILESTLMGPIEGILSSVVGSLGQSAQQNPISQLLQGFTQSFQGMFQGQQSYPPSPFVPQSPVPFAQPYGTNSYNPLGSLRGFGSPSYQLGQTLGRVGYNAGYNAGANGLPYGSTSSFGSSPYNTAFGSNLNNTVTSGGSQIDSLENQANSLMASNNPSDQLKGQQLEQQASRMFESLSKFLSSLSDMQRTAISNIH